MRAGKRLVDAGYDFDQRALAAPVLARDALHFAGQDFEGDALERFNAAERDAYVAKRQDRRQVLQFADAATLMARAFGKRSKSDTLGSKTPSRRASPGPPL